jgi:hypothetical protein
MPTNLRRTLAVLALAPALVLAACGTTPAAQVPTEVPAPTAGPTETTMPVPQEPTPVLQPYANFTRQQYEDAIAKWRTAGVQRYRIKSTFSAFSLLSGTWNLTVDSSAGPPNVVEYSSEAGGRSAGVTPQPQDLHMFTVEGMFERVGEIVTNAPPAGLTTVPTPGSDFSMYYLVTFDSTLGYPTNIEQHPNTGPVPQIADADTVLKVESLEVLEPQTPGMPRTGEPKP